jgi:hypothetical protein
MSTAEKKAPPPLSQMFTDVYATPPANLVEQAEAVRVLAEAHPEAYVKAH